MNDFLTPLIKNGQSLGHMNRTYKEFQKLLANGYTGSIVELDTAEGRAGTKALGIEVFRKLFEVILTDNGNEFQNPDNLETSLTGKKRTAVYDCGPYRSNQKGALEKNHEYIRYIRPKGTLFEDFGDQKVTLLMNHINSKKRDSLNGHSPFELSQLLLDYKIEPDHVSHKPGLLK